MYTSIECTTLTKGPDIRFATKLCMCDDLRSCPLDGEFGTLRRSVLIIHNKPSQTKVSHFDHVPLTNEAITSSLREKRKCDGGREEGGGRREGHGCKCRGTFTICSTAYQISVNEAIVLKVLHSRADLQGHVKNDFIFLG